MSSTKRRAADLLFGVQIVFTVIFGGGQLYRMYDNGKGVSIGWFVFWEIFLLINLVLAIRAHKNQPSRVTYQALTSYILWVAVVTASIAVMLLRGTGEWRTIDTWTGVIVVCGLVATVIVATRKNLSLTDPVVKGYYALFLKGCRNLLWQQTLSW